MGSWLNRPDVETKVELSTSGDLINPGLPTNYPFQAGGTAGGPIGWACTSGSTASVDITITTDTALNRFSHSLPASATAVAGRWWFWDLLVPIVQNHSYRLVFSVRTMDTKANGSFVANFNWCLNGVNIGATMGITGTDTTSSWQDRSINIGGLNAVPAPTANQLRIQIGFAGGILTAPANWGVQYTNLYLVDYTPSTVPIVWQDISCDVQSMAWRYGRERYTNRYDVASGTVVLVNNAGRYAYQSPHPLNLGPGRLVRISARLGSTWYPQYYGIIDSIKDGYSLDGHAITTLALLDPSSLASDIPTPTTGLFSVKSEDRANNLLNIAGYANRIVDTGGWMMQPPTSSSRPIREDIGVQADSEGGAFFADRSGQVIYHNRNWRTTDPHLMNAQANLMATSAFELGLPDIDNYPDVANVPTICVRELDTDWSRNRVINHVELASAGQTAKVYDDKVSQKKVGVATYSRMDFVLAAYEDGLYGYRDQRAADLMNGYAYPVLRVNAIGYRLDDNDPVDQWAFSLQAFLNWAVRIWYSHPIHGWGYALVTHIQSIEHRVTLHDWEIRCSVDLMENFETWQLVPSHNGWDQGLWDTSLWDQL